MRVALYARVSTEEQVKHGLSIDTQLANLREWASNNNHTVVSEYVDLGISARKNPSKRPALSRLLKNLGEIDAVAFTKLDRWTRNIKGYYTVQDQLDKAKVAWIATQEDYETVTASGRFKVNIMLSVAENEADRTSERIKVVFDRKVAKGECINKSPPLGFTVIDKHLVPDENADIVRGVFLEYQMTGKVYAALDYLHAHGFKHIYSSTRGLLGNELYAGRYRGNPTFCTPIIPPEEFDRVQEMLKERSIRHNPTKREYIFSGMIHCAECGYTMTGLYNERLAPQNRYRYRCDRHFLNHICGNGVFIKESELEEALVSKLEQEVKTLVLEVKPKPKTPKTDTKKLNRLNELYIDGIITREEFNTRREKLITPPTPTPDLSIAKTIALSDNIRESYYSLPRQERRMLWRNIVKSIEVKGDSVTVAFVGSN